MSAPPTYFMLTVSGDHLEAHYGPNLHSYDAEGRYVGDRTVFESGDHYFKFFADAAKAAGVDLHDLMVMCSSTVDFPEDETNNEKTIALCRMIRGA